MLLRFRQNVKRSLPPAIQPNLKLFNLFTSPAAEPARPEPGRFSYAQGVWRFMLFFPKKALTFQQLHG
jgi:hypothetical protein